MRRSALLLTLLALAAATFVVLRSQSLDRSAASQPRWTQSPLAYSQELDSLFAAHRDAGIVVSLNAANGYQRWQQQVGERPGRLGLLQVGGAWELIVSCEGSGEIWSLDPESGEINYRLEVGHAPRGFAEVRPGVLAVALHLDHQVAFWDLVKQKSLGSLPTHRFPTSVLANPAHEQFYISNFYTGKIEIADTDSLAITRAVDIGPQANQIPAMLLHEDETTLVIPYLNSNTVQPELHLANTIFPMVSLVPTDGAAATHVNLALIGEVVNGPEALALLPRKNLLLSVNSRSNDLSAIDLTQQLSAGLVEVGRFPLGIAVDPDGDTAWILNAFDHSISVVDLNELREIARWSYGEEVLPAHLARGRDLFHDADSLNLVLNQWVSCSNCHPDGASDGRIWRLPGKPPLRTKSLYDFADTRPGGWLATFDEMQDEEIFIREFFLGLGLSEQAPNPHLEGSNEGISLDLDALSAYVYTLRTEESPFLVNGKLSESAVRGKKLFFSKKSQCATCHPPPWYTTSSLESPGKVANPLIPPILPEFRQVLLTDVAFDEASRKLEKLDVPSLMGLYKEPRFLHDGRAQSIADIFLRWNGADTHGVTSHLSPDDIRDLEAFVLSLPYEEPEAYEGAEMAMAVGN